MILYILFWIAYSILDGWHDTYILKQTNAKKDLKWDEYRYYKKMWKRIDSGIKILVAFAISYFLVANTIFNTSTNLFLQVMFLAFIGLTVRWWIHPMSYNYFSSQKLLHIGDSETDQWLSDPHEHYLVKSMFLLISIIFVLILTI